MQTYGTSVQEMDKNTCFNQSTLFYFQLVRAFRAPVVVRERRGFVGVPLLCVREGQERQGII